MLIAILAFVGLLISDSLWGMGVMIVLVGLACSNVFSILFSFALEHRPEQSNEVSALMIMGVSGGACYALYGRHSRYVRTGSRLDAIINMYVVI